MSDHPATNLDEQQQAAASDEAMTDDHSAKPREEESAESSQDQPAAPAPQEEASAEESIPAPVQPGEPEQPAESEPVAGESAPESEPVAAPAEAAESDAGEVDLDDDVDGEVDEDEDDEPEVDAPPAGPVELDLPDAEDIHLAWYILKVQSNRERSIADALRRKIAIEGLDDYFGEVLVPTEKVTEFKGGKKKIVERKLWPGYIAVEMHVNDDTWFAIRETSGIGDFTGSGGKPTPMQPSEIALIKPTEEEVDDGAPKLDIKFNPGDRVKVMEGNFENFEGEVSGIDETHGRVTVMLSIFGRPTPVELEYWQVEGL